MLSSSLDTFLKVSKTTYPPKLFSYDFVTLYKLYFMTTEQFCIIAKLLTEFRYTVFVSVYRSNNTGINGISVKKSIWNTFINPNTNLYWFDPIRPELSNWRQAWGREAKLPPWDLSYFDPVRSLRTFFIWSIICYMCYVDLIQTYRIVRTLTGMRSREI